MRRRYAPKPYWRLRAVFGQLNRVVPREFWIDAPERRVAAFRDFCVPGEVSVIQSMHNKALVTLAQELRKNMTKEERRLCHDFLRCYPVRFTRQKIIDHYIVDFYCAKAKLVLELDGSQHYSENAQEKDAVRTAVLEQYGLTVIRIPNNEVNQNFQGVCQMIDLAVQHAASPSERGTP